MGYFPAYRCVQKGCTNVYTETTGGDQRYSKGATCLPCYYAGQLQHNGQTPDQIEANPQLLAMMKPHLIRGGWTWDDVKHSFNTVAVAI